MRILVYSQVNAAQIETALGQPEYSYYFVLQSFLPVLRRLGEVQIVEHPLKEVDPIYEECRSRGEACVFLSFSPPHKTFIDLKCPVIPVFAWEYSTLPDEDWDDGLFNDWVAILRQCAAALTHSSFTLQSIRTALGDAYPASWAPSPVWDMFADVRQHTLARNPGALECSLTIHGLVLDSRTAMLQMPAPKVIHLPLDQQFQLREQEARGPQSESSCGEAAPISGGEAVVSEADASSSESDTQSSGRAVAEATSNTSGGPLRASVLALGRQLQGLFQWLFRPQEELRKLRALVGQKDQELLEKQNEIYNLSDLVRSKEAELFEKHNEILRTSREVGDNPYALELPRPREAADVMLSLTGVIYTAVFNPADGRKNWRDIVTAFCHTFAEHEDVTLVLKITHHGLGVGYAEIEDVLSRLAPFQCRVVALWGYLADDSYQELIRGSAYIVNASYGEGQCMPLMEYMSSGVPAVAPDSTALSDYINADNAFIVQSSAALTFWQHDARRAYRTLHFQPHWDSLADAFKCSYHCYRDDPQGYRSRQQMAVRSLHDYCSRAFVTERLRSLFEQVTAAQPEYEG